MNIIRKIIDKFDAGLELAADDIKHSVLVSLFCIGFYITNTFILSLFIPTVILTVGNILYLAYKLLLMCFAIYSISAIIYAIVCEIEYEETPE